jgi:hypothetical protein
MYRNAREQLQTDTPSAIRNMDCQARRPYDGANFYIAARW